MILRRFLPWAAITALFLTGMPASWASTVPDNLLYEGRILDREGQPVTSAIVLRFSLWKSTDYVSGDASGGSINTGASNYGGWQEAQTISPGSTGVLHAELGSSTALPTLNAELHKYLQVEVKYSGEPDTSYVLLDPTADDGADTEDRKFIGSVAFAKNAGSLGSRTIGTASGNILILGPGGRIDDAQMGDGTTATGFGINAGNAAGDAALTFGNALLPETLTFSATNARFEFSDDLYVGGTVTASGSIATNGNLTLNADNGATGATLTFGNAVTPEALLFSADRGRFEFSDDLQVQGNLTVTGTINGVALGDATRSITETLSAEFDKATYQGDASSNVGALSMTQDNITKRNYYVWTTTQATLQDYDMFVRFQLPEDFSAWRQGSSGSVLIYYRSTTASASDNTLDLSVYDTNGSPVTLVGSSSGLASTSWASTSLTFASGATWTPGREILLKFHISAKNDYQMHLGNVELRYESE